MSWSRKSKVGSAITEGEKQVACVRACLRRRGGNSSSGNCKVGRDSGAVVSFGACGSWQDGKSSPSPRTWTGRSRNRRS